MGNLILLADDSPTIQKVIRLALADTPYDLSIVDNPGNVLLKARELKANLMMVDISLAGKDGYTLCDEIKSDPILGSIPVVLLYGAFEHIDEDRFKRVHADGRLRKPFSTQELFKLFGVLLSNKKSLHSRSWESGDADEAALREAEELSEHILSELSAGSSLVDMAPNTPPAPGKKEKEKNKKIPDFSYLDEEVWVPPKEKKPVREDKGESVEDIFSVPPVIFDAKPPISSISDTAEARDMVRDMTKEIIERVAWEVVPQIAEAVVKEEIKKILEEME